VGCVAQAYDCVVEAVVVGWMEALEVGTVEGGIRPELLRM
jgi:hypothetical protein